MRAAAVLRDLRAYHVLQVAGINICVGFICPNVWVYIKFMGRCGITMMAFLTPLEMDELEISSEMVGG